VKIDVQGAECWSFSGLAELSERSRFPRFFVEASEAGLKQVWNIRIEI